MPDAKGASDPAEPRATMADSGTVDAVLLTGFGRFRAGQIVRGSGRAIALLIASQNARSATIDEVVRAGTFIHPLPEA